MTQLINFYLNSALPLYLTIFAVVALLPESVKSLLSLFTSIKISKITQVSFWGVLILLAVVLILFILSGFFVDSIISPSVASITAEFVNGGEVYPDPESPFIRGLLYGPMLYVINGFFIKLIGASIFSTKIASLLAVVSAFLLFYFTLGRQLSPRAKLLMLGALAGLLMLFIAVFTLEVRADPLLLFFTTLALYISTRTRSGWVLFLTSIAIGIAVNLKITGVFYFIPALYLLWRRYGSRMWGVIIPASLGTAALPFIFFANINFGNFMYWLQVAGRHNLDLGGFAHNILYAVFASLPFIFYLWSTEKTKEDESHNLIVRYIIYVSVASLLISLFASKTGSGASHLMPLFPFFVYGYALIYRRLEELKVMRTVFLHRAAVLILLPFVSTIILFSVLNAARMIRLYSVYPAEAKQDVEDIILLYNASTIQMGYSNGSPSNNLNTNLPSFRVLPVFAGSEYVLDRPALADLVEAGYEAPQSFTDAISDCREDVWLFPKGGEPFFGVTGYGKELFSSDMRQVFLKAYKYKESSRYYDIWTCGTEKLRP